MRSWGRRGAREHKPRTFGEHAAHQGRARAGRALCRGGTSRTGVDGGAPARAPRMPSRRPRLPVRWLRGPGQWRGSGPGAPAPGSGHTGGQACRGKRRGAGPAARRPCVGGRWAQEARREAGVSRPLARVVGARGIQSSRPQPAASADTDALRARAQVVVTDRDMNELTATKWLAKHPRPGAHARLRSHSYSMAGPCLPCMHTCT